jgi:transposase
MKGIVPALGRHDKRRLIKNLRKCKDGRLKTRYQMVKNLLEGRSVADTARALGVAESTVRRVAARFREAGEAGLIDRREENGERKLDEDFLGILHKVVMGNPPDYGWRRPTWTRELLVKTMQKLTGQKIHAATMSRALKQIGARRGRPKPTVDSLWSKRAKRRKLREIQELLDNLPEDEVAVYEDEVDIHLNPKIGLDWMVKGQQKQVVTPGKNEKRYLAGAQNVRTGELIWVEGERKTSLLFIRLLWELVMHYREAKVIHVILDNYSIHSTKQVEVSLKTPLGRRLKLHFLPPYCPDDNKIERTWQDLHANVTRNHTRPTMKELMNDVRYYLRKRNRQVQKALAI